MHNRKKLWTAMPALIVLLLLVTAVTSYAWLCMDKTGNFQLSADRTPDVSIAMASYDAKKKAYQWSQFVTVAENHERSNSYGDAFSINSPNSHFGEINNLTTPDVSNCTWFCIRVHEEEGRSFKNLRLQYAQKPFQFYGSTWKDGKPDKIIPAEDYPGVAAPSLTAEEQKTQAAMKNAVDSIGADLMKPLMYVAKPTENFVTNIPPQDFLPTNASFTVPGVDLTTADFIRTAEDNGASGFSGTAAAVDANGYYYIYLRSWPNFQKVLPLVRKINLYMPCYLSFQELKVTIDVTTDGSKN